MATKTDKNKKGSTETKAMQVRYRFNEKTEQNRKSVYLRVVIPYSRLKKNQKFKQNRKIKKRKIYQKEQLN